MQYLTRENIIVSAEKIFSAFTDTCNSIDEKTFFKSADSKWSIAENVEHIVISTNTAKLAYTLPAFIVRWVGGKPNRDSKSYEALIEKYKTKLKEGGKASGRYIPKTGNKKYSKEKIMHCWNIAASKFIAALKNKTTETKLDDYLVKHRLLGRITLRELCYFTIYHTEHHLNIIQNSIERNH